MKIALVTDSTADIPDEIIHRYQINVVPNVLVIDGISLEEGVDISREEFYNRLPQMQNLPTTSTASSGKYLELYERLINSGIEHILSIHVSSKLSGIYNAASAAAEAFSERVRVIDSQQITLGLGFQVIAAAESIARGLGVEEILRIIDDVRERALVVAMLDTLEYVARSGRVSWARARIGNLLRVKPFIKVISGEVLRFGDARTRQRGIERLKEILLDLGPLERLGILHSNAESDAREFMQELDIKLPTTVFLVNVTTVIGVHVGPNGLGFATVVKNK
jgi:DegV family protein with EDD domain